MCAPHTVPSKVPITVIWLEVSIVRGFKAPALSLDTAGLTLLCGEHGAPCPAHLQPFHSAFACTHPSLLLRPLMFRPPVGDIEACMPTACAHRSLLPHITVVPPVITSLCR